MRCLVFVLLLAAVGASAEAAKNRTLNYTWLTDGDTLWSGILRDCHKVQSISCIQKNAYGYMDGVVRNTGDLNVTGWLSLKKNSLDYQEQLVNVVDLSEEPRDDASPIEEVAEALRDKSAAFLMTHDLEVKLPDALFDGATFKVSPRSIEGTGVLVRLDMIPRDAAESRGSVGRIFFKKIKKIIQGRLLMAFLALVLVLKLIKIKLLFVAPIILGAATAKKILLKFMLFLFPPLSHLFKLCSYYHDNYHTKYHHHHHQIAHVHHVPSLHHTVDGYAHAKPSLFQHEQDHLEFSGPGLGPEYISHRNTLEHTPHMEEDQNVLKAWGLDQHGSGSRRSPVAKTPLPNKHQVEMLAAQAEKEVMLKARLRQEQLRLRQENVRLQEQLKQELKMQEQLRLQAIMHSQQQKSGVAASQLHSHAVRVPAGHDPFYSPILQRVDKILASMGVREEPCKERLVCSMYKDPGRFSPHSNLLSAELSRDPKELQKPTDNNDVVVRFYRYVQAARDGQDMRECSRLYPSCPLYLEN